MEEYYEGEFNDLKDTESGSILEYEISAAPNDFNINTLYDFIKSGIVRIPGFQRNYVWDLKRASKLIESLLIGIPIPQIFLYEESKNKFLVIDGQQRYMTIYYFKNKRFPRYEKRFELRRIFDESGEIPEKILFDNTYFQDFELSLSESLPGRTNRFNHLNYSTLEEEDRISLNLRTIRNVIIKQNRPEEDSSVIFEIFNRLNTGGMNLKPQEIRTSLFHSRFYDMLYRINLDENWRKLTPTEYPDLNMRDIEIILRGFAMLNKHLEYRPSMLKFLNSFSIDAKTFSIEVIKQLEDLFLIFVKECVKVDNKLFFSKGGRFNISVFEAIFVATCENAFNKKNHDIAPLFKEKVENLKGNSEFIEATQSGTSGSANVKTRINKAKEIL